VGQPLWVLAVYLLVTALAPLQARVHRRHPAELFAALVAASIAADIASYRWGLTMIGSVSYLTVYLACQQLGFAYRDGVFNQWSPRRLLLGSAAATAVLLGLVTWGPYPVSMVGVPGEAHSNMSPPTVCVLLLAVAQLGVLLALRPRLARWLERPRVWAATVVVNLQIMTIFLWHLTALVLAAGALDALGVTTQRIGTAGWWAWRPVWLVTSAAVLVALVGVFGRFETGAPRPAGPRSLRTGTAFTLAFGAIATITWYGFAGPWWRAAVAAAALAAATWLLTKPEDDMVVRRPLRPPVRVSATPSARAAARSGRPGLGSAAPTPPRPRPSRPRGHPRAPRTPVAARESRSPRARRVPVRSAAASRADGRAPQRDG
jgi:hypothetical protein